MDLENKKKKKINNLKIFGVMRKVAPYILLTGGICGSLKIMGNSPFVLEEEKVISHSIEEYDNDGNIKIESQYGETVNKEYVFSNIKNKKNINLVYKYSAWEKNDDGYKRNVDVYEKDKEELFFNFTENRNNVSDKELQRGNYISSIEYSLGNGEYIIKEKTGEDSIVYEGVIHNFDTYLNNLKGSIFDYSKWQKNDDGTYSREVKIYEISDADKINSEVYERKIPKENIGNFVTLYKETRNDLTEEEINKLGYFKIAIHDENENDYIFVKESHLNNLVITIFGFISFMPAYGCVFLGQILISLLKKANDNQLKSEKELEENKKKTKKL